jgi:hypothetical protein
LYAGIAGLILLASQSLAVQTARPPAHQKANDALLQAATDGDIGRVKALVEHGAKVNAQDTNFQTPLILAAEQGHVDVMRFLIHHGAAIEARDRYGNTPLLQATDEGQVQAVQLLLECGANVHARNDYGSNALWLTGRIDQPGADHAPAIRRLLLARIRQETRQQTTAGRVQRQLQPLYDRYAAAYHDRHWAALDTILARSYTFYDWDGGASARPEWLQTLRQQREENPDYPFWFVLERVTAHSSAATVRVYVPGHYIWEDSWRQTRRGWRLYHTQMVGMTTGPPSPTNRQTAKSEKP